MRRFLGPILLAGCSVAAGNPVPQAARLSADVLTVTLSDGTVCQANWAAAGGVGRLEPCGPGYGYAVREVADRDGLRRLSTGLTEPLGAEGAAPPMAEVVITDPAGIDRVFVSAAADLAGG
ncbi:hypothetical protein [Tabrizicola sp. BL-A-41-H6]|uniref:hypothetical protein n=1 Tax=Tabrizicola sp. BL-A-41-H6 TaxID=3421107 RepID=UPI003D66C80B